MIEEPQGAPDSLRRAARVLWPNLPVLLTGSLLVAASWSVVRLLSPHLGSMTVVGIGLLVVPPFAALLRGCEILLTDEHFGFRHLLRALRTSYVPAVKVAVLPMLTVLLLILALEVWQVSQQSWMLASVALSLGTSLLALYTGVVALPYVVGSGVRLLDGWLVAFYIATRQPIPVLAALSAIALVVWAAAYLSFALIVLLPAPLALVWAASVAAASERSRIRLAVRTRQSP